MPGRRKRMVGLSIGPRVMAVAQNHINASGAIVTDRLGVSDVPAGAIDNYEITDIDAVSQAVRDLLITSNIGSEEVTLVITGDSIITGIMTLPSMLEDEMMEVLRGEVENYAVLGGDEAVLDFQIVDQNTVGTAQQVEVLVVAAPNELINSYKAVMEAADLKLLALEIIPVAILRILTSGQPGNQINGPAMLVNIEDSGGTIVVIRDEVIRFIHSIEVRAGELSGDGSALERLADELKSSLDYYQTSSSGSEDLEEIILLIDGVSSDYICEGLKKYLPVPISVPKILETADEHIEAQTMEHGLSAYAAVGAAAWTGSSDGAINLLRPQRVKKASLRSKLAIFCLCFLSIVLLSICANFLLNAKANAIIQSMVSTQQAHGDSDAREWIEISAMKADTSQLESQVDMVKATINSTRRVDWVNILEEISMIVPKTMWLTKLSWEEGNNIAFNGVAMSYGSVLMFRDTLTDSPCFDSVRLVFARNSEISNISIVRFQILCRMEQIP